MGVVGAAVATMIARLIEVALVLGYVYGTKCSDGLRTFRELFGWPAAICQPVSWTPRPR